MCQANSLLIFSLSALLKRDYISKYVLLVSRLKENKGQIRVYNGFLPIFRQRKDLVNASIYEAFDWLKTPILIQCTLWTVRGCIFVCLKLSFFLLKNALCSLLAIGIKEESI